MVRGLQIHLQRLALSAGHTAYKERLEELQTLKLHLKNASREVRLALHTTRSAAYQTTSALLRRALHSRGQQSPRRTSMMF